MQIKDIHNGNILIDYKGHLIHIDFGFMLSNAPGKGIKFEKAPFKITDEMLELIGGINSDNFKEYRKNYLKDILLYMIILKKFKKWLNLCFMDKGNIFPVLLKKKML